MRIKHEKQAPIEPTEPKPRYTNAKPVKAKPEEMMLEKGGIRGLVPTATYGRLDTPYNTYLSSIDVEHNEALHEAMASTTDKRFQEFYARLGTPRYKTWSMAALAKSCDITLPQMQEFYQKAQVQRSIALVQTALPKVTEGIVEEALAKYDVCPRCDGLCFVEATLHHKNARPLGDSNTLVRDCPMCKGKGEVKVAGNRESQKMALELTGLMNKKTPAIVLNQNFGGMSMDSAVDKLNNVGFAVDDSDVIDVEAEPTSSEEA